MTLMRPTAALLGMALFGPLAAPAMAIDLSAEVGLVSDYRYRGYSPSDGNPAVQGSLTLEHDSGAYGSIWSSTIEESGFDADVEIDLTGGYWLEISQGFGLDLSATYYVYPSESGTNYLEATAVVERSAGTTTLKAGFSHVPRQAATRDENGRKRSNSYLFAGTSYKLPEFPLTLSAEVGHESGFFDEVDGSGKWDWTISGKLALKQLRLGLAYCGTDAGRDAVVVSLSVEF